MILKAVAQSSSSNFARSLILPSYQSKCFTLKNNPSFQSISRFLSTKTSDLAPKKTALYDFHVSHGAKMVPFGGYSMPIQYKDGVVASHLFCRSNVVIFDVSHMLQTSVSGKDAVSFMESLTVCDIKSLQDNSGSLTVFTTERGTIIDDLIVNKITNEELYVVSNAGCAEKDLALLKLQEEKFKNDGKDVSVDVIPKSLLAVQGPKMMELLQPLVNIDLSKMPFMTTSLCDIGGLKDLRITRCGYTGEDGVEIQVSDENVVQLADMLTSRDEECRMAGLAARDSLRLEAGLCLYGNDIDETTTPNEAGLLWLVGKQRRKRRDFPGSDVVMTQITDGSFLRQKRVGLKVEGAPARQGAEVRIEGENIGHVTSGCPSPSLKENIAMAYVKTEFSKIGTELHVKVREKEYPAIVTKMPFVKTNYYFL
ncbi:aminomethyltransferase, mitochondrial-like [Symsagittifera roscoffensis]|uniref:aminomethyltransferase, mitochondrial-like n=1 Tax=Symsagittifera roscoffensis TaxID=84072 RepID=UPI00307C3757